MRVLQEMMLAADGGGGGGGSYFSGRLSTTPLIGVGISGFGVGSGPRYGEVEATLSGMWEAHMIKTAVAAYFNSYVLGSGATSLGRKSGVGTGNVARLEEKISHPFTRESIALRYIWNASFYRDGSAYKEHLIYVFKDGKVMLMPVINNKRNSSVTFERYFQENNDGTFSLNGRQILKLVHTHLDFLPIGTINVSDNDKRFMIKHPSIIFQTIGTGGIIYQVWPDGRYESVGRVK